MRTSDWLVGAAFLLTAGCDRPATETGNAQAPAAADRDQHRATEGDETILCARNGNALRRDCIVEQTRAEGHLILTVRHADGGFHRLLVTQDGRGVVAADGAQAARISAVDKQSIDVTIGTDRYRLPATITAGR